MRPIKFSQQNTIWAADQLPYLPLPAYSSGNMTISLWKLSWSERLKLLFTGQIWLKQLNFGQPLQPQKLMIHSPFIDSKPAVP